MNRKRFWIIFAGLAPIALSIHLYSADPGRVESNYSAAIYPPFAAFLRQMFGWLPFSFGDLLYGSFGVWILWKLISSIRALYKKKVTIQGVARGFLKALIILLSLYVSFNLFWGINYNRKGIAAQLNMQMGKYSISELKDLNALLVEKVNSARQSLINSNQKRPSSNELFKQVQEAYAVAGKSYPFLQYHTVSLKPSLWGWLGNYTGFTGYYNPFTGEAQVNTMVPFFLQPYISCHEVAHQLGYAKEMEANFVGYLAAAASVDTLLHYSVYLDLFLYSNRNLFITDSLEARAYAKQLLPAVIKDIKEWKDFQRRHRNPIEPVIRWAYGKYLENNEQPQGVLSYDEVTSFMVAYYKKFGKI